MSFVFVRRLALAVSLLLIFLLEISFLITSDVWYHLIPYAPLSLASVRILWQVMGVSPQPNVLINWDVRCLEFTAAVFILFDVYFMEAGVGKALLKGVRATSFVLLPLPIEIYLFDNYEFNEYAATLLKNTPLAWLSNEVLLWLFVASVILTTLLLKLRK